MKENQGKKGPKERLLRPKDEKFSPQSRGMHGTPQISNEHDMNILHNAQNQPLKNIIGLAVSDCCQVVYLYSSIQRCAG
jgi:hypothetical protein